MNPLIEKYQDYPDERLLEILFHKRDYVPQAVEAAEYWVKERKLTDSRIQEIEKGFREKAQAKSKAAREPLQAWEKVLFLLIPIVGIAIFLIAQVTYADQGKSKKARDAGLYTLIGSGIWGGLLWFLMSF
ncbi:MAG: hypothetical protein AAF135_08220 [Bacteroidota bacterium]